MQSAIAFVAVPIYVVHANGVETAGGANDPINVIPLLQEKFREVRTILSGNSCNQCLLHVYWRAISDVLLASLFTGPVVTFWIFERNVLKCEEYSNLSLKTRAALLE